MLKKLVVALTLVAAAAGTAYAGVTVRYYNKDSQSHTFEAVCSGARHELKVSGSTTGSSTIQGSAPCKVKHAGGEVELKGGENIEIKDGKITVK
jgi:plastocyanin